MADLSDELGAPMTRMNCWSQAVAFPFRGPLMRKYPSIAYLAYLNPRMAASRMFNRGSDRPKLADSATFSVQYVDV